MELKVQKLKKSMISDSNYMQLRNKYLQELNSKRNLYKKMKISEEAVK